MENMDCTKMGADKSAKDTPKCPKLYLPKLSAQAKSLGFGWKKASLGVHSPCIRARKSPLSPLGPQLLFQIWLQAWPYSQKALVLVAQKNNSREVILKVTY